MSVINFGYRLNMVNEPSPLLPDSFLLGYDLDGVLKQKDHLGNITPIGNVSIVSGSQSPFYLKGTSNDALSNKAGAIYRPGSLIIGTGSTPNDTRFAVSSINGTVSFSVNEVGVKLFGSQSLQYQDGFQANGRYLKSDNNGNSQWSKISTSDIDGFYSIISATYGVLNELVIGNDLIVGGKYILLEYQTKYQINSSNSSNIYQVHTIIGAAAGYCQFVNVPEAVGSPGNFAGIIVTVAQAGPSASVTVGQTVTITAWYSSAYIAFSPAMTSSNNIGVKLKFERQRFPNVTPGATYSDNYGKPIMKPGGVINTDVHDGTPYMSMSGVENPAPILESIILTAIDTNKFSRDAESLTFPGDKLTYDYTNNKIYDENGDLIGERPGLIINRTNIDGSISINKDWRVQRYRRYGLDTTSWDKMTLSNSNLYRLNGTASGNNVCTYTNTSYISTDHRYLANAPYMLNFYNDFTKNGISNVFLSGTPSAPGVAAGSRANAVLSGYEYMNDITITSFTQSVKDFHIIPISNGQATNLVERCIIGNLSNSVFLPYSQTYGSTFNMNIESRNGIINNSSFMSLGSITNTGTLESLKVIDNFTLVNRSNITNCIVLSYGALENTGELTNTTIGGGNGPTTKYVSLSISDDSVIINSILGGHRVENTRFVNFYANKSLLMWNQGGLLTYSGKLYLTHHKNQNNTYGSSITINTYVNQNPNKSLYGYMYDYNIALNDAVLNNNTNDKRLVYQELNSAGVIVSTTASIAQ